MTRLKPSPGTLIALLALFVALGGPAEAAKLLSGTRIKPNSISSKRIKNHTLTSKDISKKTVASFKRASSSVGSAQILDGSVSLADLAFGSVTGNQVVDRSLSAVDLAPDSLGAGELATGSVGNAELGADAVTNNKVATNAVTKGSIKSDAVGTEEVIDRSLTGADFAQASGTLTATFPDVPAGECAAAQTVTATGAAAGSAVVVNARTDTSHVFARVSSANTVSLRACNDAATGMADITGPFPYLVLAP